MLKKYRRSSPGKAQRLVFESNLLRAIVFLSPPPRLPSAALLNKKGAELTATASMCFFCLTDRPNPEDTEPTVIYDKQKIFRNSLIITDSDRLVVMKLNVITADLLWSRIDRYLYRFFPITGQFECFRCKRGGEEGHVFNHMVLSRLLFAFRALCQSWFH